MKYLFVDICIWKLCDNNKNNLSINWLFLFNIGWSTASNKTANSDGSKSILLLLLLFIFIFNVNVIRWLLGEFESIIIIDERFCNGFVDERVEWLLNDWFNLKINSHTDKSRIFGYNFDGIVNNCLSKELTFVVIGSFDDKIAGSYCWSLLRNDSERNCSDKFCPYIINDLSGCR